jgi:biotin synthase
MGETSEDRILMLLTLANMTPPPESVPLNKLMPFPGTPLADQAPIDGFEFVRTVALARILMPTSFIRLSAGRQTLSDELQALCFLAGANSIFYGEKLLTAANPAPEADQHLFHRLGLRAMDLGGFKE